MSYFVLTGTIALFVFFVIAKEAMEQRKKEQKEIKSLYQDYGIFVERKYQAERFERIGSYYKKHRPIEQVDDITWNDLNMDELFKRMNFTFSATGEEYLYFTLRDLSKSQDQLEHFESLVTYFMSHAEERVKLQRLMKRLGYTGKFSLYDYLDYLDDLPVRNRFPRILCNVAILVLFCSLPFWTMGAVIGLICLLVYSICTYYVIKGDIEPYIISFAYIIRLLEISDEVEKVSLPVCTDVWEAIKKHKKELQPMRTGAFLVLWGNQGVKGNPLEVLFDYLKMIFHVDLLQFYKMLSQVREHLEDIDVLIEKIGYIETAISVGAFRNSLEEEFCTPEFCETETYVMEDGYHPLLHHPVKNSITAQKGVLLTGSNASGKSTFLKMVAVNAILAQTIFTCTAKKYQSPMLHVMSSMALRDDMENGESYYIVEIKALQRVLRRADEGGKRVLCVVDEVLRGTNTLERIAAATQILCSFVEKGMLCFAATHDLELAELLQDFYDNYHFEEEIEGGDIYFPYVLLPGPTNTRNAIRLLELMGYHSHIIEKAEKMVQEFEDTGKWKLER